METTFEKHRLSKPRTLFYPPGPVKNICPQNQVKKRHKSYEKES